MNPNRLPSAQRRVPKSKIVTGTTMLDELAISPKVTTPLLNACPDEPRIAKAVM
jgi:hypothetical protein